MKVFNDYKNELINEFKGYNINSLKQDLMAGITVTAVALPLALAFVSVVELVQQQGL